MLLNQTRPTDAWKVPCGPCFNQALLQNESAGIGISQWGMFVIAPLLPSRSSASQQGSCAYVQRDTLQHSFEATSQDHS